MGLFDLFKNKKLEETKKLCLDAYNKGDLEVIGGAINVMCQKKKTKDAVAILKYIAQKITITNDKEFGRAKELRKFWKKINPSSYKKDGLILKNKYKEFLSKNVSNQAQACLSFFNQGKMDLLFKNLKTIYELEPNVCRHILKFIAQNTRCDDNLRLGVTKEYMTFWSKLDSSHYNEYQAKLQKDYVAAISKLSKSSVQKFLTACTVSITKP